ncbi:MAG: hypothetical protein ACKV2U_23165 [Bryobacteraceae bacterium]
MSIDISSVRLPDEAFWQSGADHGRDPLVRKYKTSHFGVLVDAPREVAIAGQKTLPLFAYYMGTFAQVASRSFLDHGLLVAVDPDRNELYVADAEQDDGERIRVPNTAKAEDMPTGWVAEIKDLDVRERIQLPWKPGRILLQVVLLDLPSNRVETKLNGGPSAFVDPEKEKFLAEERGRQNPPGPFPALPASAYAPTADSPAIPADPGIALRASRVVVVEGKAPVLLHGAFRLPVAPEETVKPNSGEYNKEHGLTGYAACLTIHLLVAGTGQQNPFQYRLRIPATNVNAGMATSHFTLDLSKLPDFPLSEQTVFLYAYAKEWATEPVTIGLIDRRSAD